MKNTLKLLIALIAMAADVSSCSKGVSYTDLINDENKAVNRYLVDQRVIPQVPADSVFEVGPNAPYYQLDEDGNIFMQVRNAGDPDMRAQPDDLVYFRFMASDLSKYTTPEEMTWSGNAQNLDQVNPTSFRYGNFSLTSSSRWGSGLQLPLAYLGYNCEVFIVIKSQYGPTDMQSAVHPYVYNVRYYKAQI